MIRVRALMLGIKEFRRSFTTSFVGEPNEYALYVAYDQGRDLAHRLTLRRFEEDL